VLPSNKGSKAAVSEAAQRRRQRQRHPLQHLLAHSKAALLSIPPEFPMSVTVKANSSLVGSASTRLTARAVAAPVPPVFALDLVRLPRLERLVVDLRRRGPFTFPGVASTFWTKISNE